MKIDSYESGRKISSEFDDFMSDTETIINFGKYQNQVVTNPPAWKAENGEAVLFTSANTNRWYFYLANNWNSLEFTSQQINGWLSFSGTGTVTVYDSFNVASVTDNGKGDYTINWDIPFNTRSYAVCASAKKYVGGSTMMIRVMNTGDSVANPVEGSVRLHSMVWLSALDANPLTTDVALAHVFTIGQ